MRGRKSKLVMDRYIVQCRHNPVTKQKPKNQTKPKNKNTQAKQTKTHNTKQTEKGKSGRQTSYVRCLRCCRCHDPNGTDKAAHEAWVHFFMFPPSVCFGNSAEGKGRNRLTISPKVCLLGGALVNARPCGQESSVPGQHPQIRRVGSCAPGRGPIPLYQDAGPIVMGVTWRKVAFTCTLALDKQSIWDRLLPTQLVVGVSCGPKSCYQNRQRNNYVLSTKDIRNAFNELLPQEFLQDAQQHPPASARFAAYCYGSPTNLVYQGTVERCSRGQQGWPHYGATFLPHPAANGGGSAQA